MKAAASRTNRNRLLRAALAAMLGAAVLVGDMSSSARADDDDDAFDIKIFRDVLRTLGLRPGDGSGINYRERSPLVVPPNRNLVPPVTTKSNENNPAWPNDPDVKQRKEATAKSKLPRRGSDAMWDEDSRPLRPDQLRPKGTGTPGQIPADNSNRNVDLSTPLKPSELGYKGGLFSGIFGGPKEEYGTFTGEAPRTDLTQPPAGYRTPSPYQPYGVGKEKWVPPKIDRHELVR